MSLYILGLLNQIFENYKIINFNTFTYETESLVTSTEVYICITLTYHVNSVILESVILQLSTNGLRIS